MGFIQIYVGSSRGSYKEYVATFPKKLQFLVYGVSQVVQVFSASSKTHPASLDTRQPHQQPGADMETVELRYVWTQGLRFRVWTYTSKIRL